jgi:hypothetical protein
MKPFDEKGLREQISRLPGWRRIAFMLLCCERMTPIPYTSAQSEAAIAAAMSTHHKKDYRVQSNNCSTSVGGALADAGIPVQPLVLPGDMFNQVARLPGVQVFQTTPGAPSGQLPNMSSFNPHP